MNYYEILQIDKSATSQEIKQAFRELAKQHHPDKGGTDKEYWNSIKVAYEVLSDPLKRERYDKYRITPDQYNKLYNHVFDGAIVIPILPNHVGERHVRIQKGFNIVVSKDASHFDRRVPCTFCHKGLVESSIPHFKTLCLQCEGKAYLYETICFDHQKYRVDKIVEKGDAQGTTAGDLIIGEVECKDEN